MFNPLSFARDILVECALPAGVTGVQGCPSQVRSEGHQNTLIFVARRVPAFGFREFTFETKAPRAAAPPFSATATTLEGPFYRLRVDPSNGGLASLVHKASGQELLDEDTGRSLCQTVFNDGQEHLLSDIEGQTQMGSVYGEMRVTGHAGDLRVTNVMRLYATLDQVDFDVRVAKPISTNEQRLLHFFPIGDGVRDLRLETTAAVLRPQLQPEGDLLPGADPRRFAVQDICRDHCRQADKDYELRQRLFSRTHGLRPAEFCRASAPALKGSMVTTTVLFDLKAELKQ